MKSSPGLSLTRLHAHAFECGGDFGSRPSRCDGSHDRQSLLRRTLAIKRTVESIRAGIAHQCQKAVGTFSRLRHKA